MLDTRHRYRLAREGYGAAVGEPPGGDRTRATSSTTAAHVAANDPSVPIPIAHRDRLGPSATAPGTRRPRLQATYSETEAAIAASAGPSRSTHRMGVGTDRTRSKVIEVVSVGLGNLRSHEGRR